MKSLKFWLYCSLISFLLSSLTIWFMPYVSFGENSALAFTIAAAFWLFMVGGFIFLSPINQLRREEKEFTSKKNILHFFSNKPAIIFDILIIIGLGIIILAFLIDMPDWFMSSGLFTFLFSLEMHGLFNGKNYEYVNQ